MSDSLLSAFGVRGGERRHMDATLSISRKYWSGRGVGGEVAVTPGDKDRGERDKEFFKKTVNVIKARSSKFAFPTFKEVSVARALNTQTTRAGTAFGGCNFFPPTPSPPLQPTTIFHRILLLFFPPPSSSSLCLSFSLLLDRLPSFLPSQLTPFPHSPLLKTPVCAGLPGHS